MIQRLCISVWSDWDHWGPCDHKCGGGMKARHRKCLHGPGCKGPDTDKAKCNDFPCPSKSN